MMFIYRHSLRQFFIECQLCLKHFDKSSRKLEIRNLENNLVRAVHQMKIYSWAQKIKRHGIFRVWYDSIVPRYNYTFQLMKFKNSDDRSLGCFIIAKDNPF